MTLMQSVGKVCRFSYVLLLGQGADLWAGALAARASATRVLLRSSMQHCCPSLVLSVWLKLSSLYC